MRLVQNHRELVPAQTRHRITVAQTVLNTACGIHQQQVADIMPQRIVYFLEMIQVNKQQGRFTLVTSGFFQHLRQPIHEQAPIGQARQRVKISLFPGFHFRILHAGNVGIGTHHAQGAAIAGTAGNQAARQYPLVATILATHPIFRCIFRRQAREITVQHMQGALGVIRMDIAQPVGIHRRQIPFDISQHAAVARREFHASVDEVHLPDAIATALQCKLPAILRFLARCHIEQRHHHLLNLLRQAELRQHRGH